MPPNDKRKPKPPVSDAEKTLQEVSKSANKYSFSNLKNYLFGKSEKDKKDEEEQKRIDLIKREQERTANLMKNK